MKNRIKNIDIIQYIRSFQGSILATGGFRRTADVTPAGEVEKTDICSSGPNNFFGLEIGGKASVGDIFFIRYVFLRGAMKSICTLYSSHSPYTI